MTHAQRIVSILLEYGEDTPEIRGEYWFIDGSAWFSDGDVGDVNHEGYAIQHAQREIMEYFGAREQEGYDEKEILEEAQRFLYEEEGIEVPDDKIEEALAEHFKRVYAANPGEADKMMETFYCAMMRGDARDTAMKLWGWKWCRGTNIGTWTFTSSDRSDIVAGYDDVIDQEAEEGVDYEQMEITVGVGATGKRYSMTLAELRSGRTPSVDPTWGLRSEASDEDLLNSMGAHVAEISTNRKMEPGEEVSRGTLNTKDLVRRTLEKLKEIHYEGWQQYLEDESEALAEMEKEHDEYPGEYPEDYLWERLTQHMNDNYVPFGCHFGSHEGSAADVGCWPSYDYLKEPGTEERVTTFSIDDPDAQDFLTGMYEPITDYVLIEHPDNTMAMYTRDGDLIWQY